MRKFIATLSALLLFIATATAQWAPGGGQYQGFWATPETKPADAFLSCDIDSTDVTAYTHPIASFGTENGSRKIVVGIGGQDTATNFTISSVTVGGVTATLVVQNTGADGMVTQAGIYSADLPTGASGDVVVTYSEQAASSVVCAWAVYSGVLPNDTTANFSTNSSAINLVVSQNWSGGFIVGMCVSADTAGTMTWTGLTERSDQQTTSSNASSADATTVGTAIAVTCDPTGTTDASGVTASFQ